MAARAGLGRRRVAAAHAAAERSGGTRVRESWDITHEKIKLIVRPARKKTRKAMEKTLARIEELVV